MRDILYDTEIEGSNFIINSLHLKQREKKENFMRLITKQCANATISNFQEQKINGAATRIITTITRTRSIRRANNLSAVLSTYFVLNHREIC